MGKVYTIAYTIDEDTPVIAELDLETGKLAFFSDWDWNPENMAGSFVEFLQSQKQQFARLKSGEKVLRTTEPGTTESAKFSLRETIVNNNLVPFYQIPAYYFWYIFRSILSNYTDKEPFLRVALSPTSIGTKGALKSLLDTLGLTAYSSDTMLSGISSDLKALATIFEPRAYALFLPRNENVFGFTESGDIVHRHSIDWFKMYLENKLEALNGFDPSEGCCTHQEFEDLFEGNSNDQELCERILILLGHDQDEISQAVEKLSRNFWYAAMRIYYRDCKTINFIMSQKQENNQKNKQLTPMP